MCGIVGAVAQRDVVPLLLEGLKRLEYRGYDSAGLAVIDHQSIRRERRVGKVSGLEIALKDKPISGHLGIAHTRWATHGKPSTRNAHPHMSRNIVAVVHNGIIENYEILRVEQLAAGYEFSSDTDTEVIVHQIYEEFQAGRTLLQAVMRAVKKLDGTYALGVVCQDDPDTLVVCRSGSPLVIGIGEGEHYIASDISALLSVTSRFIFLEEGDIAELKKDSFAIFNAKGELVNRPIKQSQLKVSAMGKGEYAHYMLKEIYEQPVAIANTLAQRFVNDQVQDSAFGLNAGTVFDSVKRVQIIACGTSYHAGLIARYWLEELAGIPCHVEVASEFRYRKPKISHDTLVVTLSQSGETADTLAALQETKKLGAQFSLAICNVPESSLVRASNLALLTCAGPEIGVASTKAFTTQLVGLMMLVLALGRRFELSAKTEKRITEELFTLPGKIEEVLCLDGVIKKLALQFAEKQNALFLGRGTQYPVAMEGALKLKEISYIHAEAYPAGELKHGPLALIDAQMPVIAVAPNNCLLEKLKSNLQEVSARGGQLYVFMDETLIAEPANNIQIIRMPVVGDELAPVVYTVPLQLLSYHVALLKNTDVDQPRNLAKSVTVE